MSRDSNLPRWWAAAQAQRLVSGSLVPGGHAPDSAEPGQFHEPSPLVIALALLGVLVCMLPLAVFVFACLGERVFTGPAGLVLSLLLLATGGQLLRKAQQVFWSCAALVLWGLGAVLLVVHLGFRGDYERPTMAALCLLAAALMLCGAWLAKARWIQAVMGLGLPVALLAFLGLLLTGAPGLLALGMTPLLMALAWLLWLHGEPLRLASSLRGWSQPRWAALADAAAVGLLAMVALLSQGFAWRMLWESTHGSDLPASTWRWLEMVLRVSSVAAVLVAVAWLLRVWLPRILPQPEASRPLRHLLLWAGLWLAVCAWFSPDLGAIALVAAAALLGARWRIACLCALLALVSLGQFYYQLAWPLALKGIGLAALGGVLLLGLWVLRASASVLAPVAGAAQQAGGRFSASGSAGRLQLIGLLAGAALVAAVVNWDVRQKEQVIAQGQRILVPLQPVDPRSLMQGDYMDLRFEMPAQLQQQLEGSPAAVAYVRAVVDDKGVARVQALAADRQSAAANEVILPLKQLKGRWVLVTDAYFFPEGQGDHFAQGRFGDLRVLPDGRALLVGLADAQGQEIKPLPAGSLWDARPAAQRLRELEQQER